MANNKRLLYLDGLRGVAAVLVVIHHLVIGFYPAMYSRADELHIAGAVEWFVHDTPLSVFVNGSFGLALFLVLSGYVAGVSQADFNLKLAHSIFKRFFRFFGLILVTNTLAAGLILGGQAWNHPASRLTGSWWWLGTQWQQLPTMAMTLEQSLLMLVKTYSSQVTLNSSLWVMPYFFLGTISVTLITLTTQKNPYKMIIYTLLIYLLRHDLYYLLVIGLLLHEVQSLPISTRFWQFFRIPLLVLGVFLAGYPQQYSTAVYSPWYRELPILKTMGTSFLYYAHAATLIVWVTLNFGWLKRFLSSQLFLILGKYSFSLFVAHILVINSLTSMIFLRLFYLLPYNAAVIVSIGASLPVMALLVYLLYHLVEKPTLWLFKKELR